MIATYREFFQVALEAEIESGGHPWAVVRLVRLHQGEDPVAREAAFREWLTERALVCGRCNRLFEPDPEWVAEDHYVLCAACRPTLA
jgi:hypothetical protein